MPAMDRSIGLIGDLSRDPSFAGATLHLDPTLWTSRRRNIVLRALRDGVTSCGNDTATFIENLTRAYGSTIVAMTTWRNRIPVDAVKPEEVNNLVAYTCAWIKMGDYPREYHLHNWVRSVERGEAPNSIPAPRINNAAEKCAFIKQYLRDDDDALDVRQTLARKIENGEKLTITLQSARTQ